MARKKVRLKSSQKQSDTGIQVAKPANSNYGLPVNIQSSRTPIKSQVVSQTKPEVRKLKVRIDLTQLVANGFVSEVQFLGDKASYTASIYIEVVDMWVSGIGKNVILATEDLNQKIIDMNFEL